ncbi:MAG: bacterial Ig-like domain-containing protein [Clostridia bacterium]|nr:bacterial Ig-like domain-containing protein [Clostridia bacterium]
MRHMRRYGLFIILVLLVVVATFALFACSTVDDSENENEIVKIRVGEFQKPEVYYGDEIDVEGATILATTRGGAVHTIPMTQSMISGYNSHLIGDQTVTITYEGQTTTLQITVLKTDVQGISINSKPNQVTVVQGSELNLAGISLKVEYQTRSIVIDNVTQAMLRGYSTDLPVGTHTVYIEYAGFTAPLQIEVLGKSVIALEIISLPRDRQYFVDERLDPSGFAVKRTYDNGSVDTIAYDDDATAFTFDYDFTYERAYSLVRVTVNGILTTFTCTVSEPVVTDFTIDVEPRTRAITLGDRVLTPSTDVLHIVEGAEIDWSTGSGTVYYDNGDKVTLPLSNTSIYPFYNSTEGEYLPKDYKFNEIGEQIIQVRYGNSNIYAPLYITINEKTPINLLLGDKRPSANPDSGLTFVEEQVYVEGNVFSTSFLVYNVLYNNATYKYDVDAVSEWGSIEERMIADDGSTFTLSMSNLASDGKQHVNFMIDGVKAGYKITVVAKKARYLKVQAPYRNEYLLNSTLDLQGSYLYVEYNDNTFERIEPIPDTALSIKDSDGNPASILSSEGTYTIEVAYAGMTTEFNVTAVSQENYVSQITLEGMLFDTVYNYANFDEIPFSSMYMNVVYGDGSRETKPLTQAEMLIYDRYASGQQDICFRYKGFVFTLKVNIEGRRVSSIEVTKAPNKLVYVLGTDTELDVTGLLITKVFNDNDRGEQSYFDSLWSFSGYDLSVEGEQTVKVSYDLGDRVYETSFAIEVANVKVQEIAFDESQPGVSSFEIGEGDEKETFRGISVTYRDDVNLTFIYNYLDNGGEMITEIRTLMLDVTYENGITIQRELKASYLSYDKNVNPNVSGNFKQTIQISYGGKTTTMNLYVVGRTLTEISVYSNPNTLAYAEGQRLNNEGGYIRRDYSDGSYDILPMTNGLISIEGYNIKPFEGVQGGTYIDQTVILSYGGKTTSFVARTYRKLHAEPTIGNSIFSYGDNSSPVITIRESITGFQIPSTTLEYLVDGSWTSERPVYPGTYALRINVIANEYYEADVFEDDTLQLIIKKKAIIIKIDALTKVYKDVDPEYTYTIEDSELVAGDTIQVAFSRESGEDVKYVTSGGQKVVGSYNITASLVQGGALYDLAYEQVGLTITPKVVSTNSLGNVIDVDFVVPNNYNTTTNVIKYSGLPIQAFGAKYTDVRGYTITIDAKDILYYDAEGNLIYERDSLGNVVLDENGNPKKGLPQEVGTYTVKISDNYSFMGRYTRTFSIQK